MIEKQHFQGMRIKVKIFSILNYTDFSFFQKNFKIVLHAGRHTLDRKWAIQLIHLMGPQKIAMLCAYQQRDASSFFIKSGILPDAL